MSWRYMCGQLMSIYVHEFLYTLKISTHFKYFDLEVVTISVAFTAKSKELLDKEKVKRPRLSQVVVDVKQREN
ncbi:hypothetical protein L2E82_20626 [Cichorium intybus]|uniref:Uncharacterized protein n=1 Tax=Cichorium intybus TaxID=13427 RepID=A0ACB9DTX5_CICIN|nr:hypothetical protein L2E82_20626 [Cichorium intybus]